MKKSVINEMTLSELNRSETELREEIFRLRFQHHTGQLASPIKLRTTRRNLARVKTRIRAFELGDVQTAAKES
ncbi:MAG: 50S ribosomal protein L29 [Myxococcales bacterium]|nr:50S ribosomal protein L29 [Myxococcales bacterium]